MKTHTPKLIFFLALSLVTACKDNTSITPIDKSSKSVSPIQISHTFSPGAQPKNVIFVIGDGTGINQISALEFYKEHHVYYDDFPIVGLSKVSSTSLITDSAAAGTAMACGEKTFNKAIGVDAQGNDLPNLIELNEQLGGANGLIATSSITHATPACFYAHHNDRNDHEIIASFLPKSSVDFFAGPGLKYFNNQIGRAHV